VEKASATVHVLFRETSRLTLLPQCGGWGALRPAFGRVEIRHSCKSVVDAIASAGAPAEEMLLWERRQARCFSESDIGRG